MRRSARVLAALTGGVILLSLAAGPARAASGRSAQAAALTAPPPSLAVTAVSPRWATRRSTVTVSGVVTNPSATPVSGLTVRLWFSSVPMASSSAMTAYLAGLGPVSLAYQAGPVWTSPFPLGGHASQHWSLKLPAAAMGMSAFGVYPIAAQLDTVTGPLAEARTFLPFWPGKSRTKSVKRLSIAWVWPLVGTPDQAACPALLSNSLAADVSRGGRLGQLLAAGQTPQAARADLTWAIDPALLSDVSAMTRRYRVGGNAACAGAATEPASAAARSWLTGVRQVTKAQNYFVTPYDDVDVAALAHRGLNSELASAVTEGRSAAQQILHGTQRPAATGPGNSPASGGGTGWIAWPAEGIADANLLAALAAPPNNVGTVILDSSMMPPASPVPYTPSAVTSTSDGTGSQVHVLLADNTITEHILGGKDSVVPGLVSDLATTSPPAVSGPPGAAAFARSQWFLAETALIAAQVPHLARSLVVAPPRRWDPGTALANALLTDTVTAPWLRPDSLAGLVTAGPGPKPVRRQDPPEKEVSRAELKASVLRQVRHLVALTRLQGSILTPRRPDYLAKAVAAAESTAWRGGRSGRRHADALARRVSAYVDAQLRQVSIIKTTRVTLGGKSGEVPVSIINHLGENVTVRLVVRVPPGDKLTIGHFDSTVTVDAKEQRTVKIPVRAAQAGSTTLSLQLATPQGRPLPGKATALTVDATHFGTLALVIIGIALLVFVLTAGARAIRRGRRQPRGELPDAGREQDLQPGAAHAPPGGDTVEPGRAEGAQAVEEPDDQATTPGRAGPAGQAGHH